MCGGDPMSFLMGSSEVRFGVSDLEVVGGMRGQPVEVINEYVPAQDSSSWAGGPDDLSSQAGLGDIDRDAGFADAGDTDNDGDYDAGFDDDSAGGSDDA